MTPARASSLAASPHQLPFAPPKPSLRAELLPLGAGAEAKMTARWPETTVLNSSCTRPTHHNACPCRLLFRPSPALPRARNISAVPESGHNLHLAAASGYRHPVPSRNKLARQLLFPFSSYFPSPCAASTALPRLPFLQTRQPTTFFLFFPFAPSRSPRLRARLFFQRRQNLAHALRKASGLPTTAFLPGDMESDSHLGRLSGEPSYPLTTTAQSGLCPQLRYQHMLSFPSLPSAPHLGLCIHPESLELLILLF